MARSESFRNGQVVAYLGDCLEIMPALHDIDMVMVDLPYGTTYASWDSVIPMSPLWDAYRKVTKPKAALAFTASQPFTSALVMSNPSWFRCEWIWDKVHAANFANAKKQPMKVHESVLIFGSGQTTYNPQKVPGPKNHARGNSISISETRLIPAGGVPDDLSGMKYPKSIQTFAKHTSSVGLHPTQKPAELYSYFFKTYSNPDEVILDNCAGSGTAGVAAIETGRRAILIESDPTYFDVICQRLDRSASSVVTSTADVVPRPFSRPPQ